MTTMIKVIKRDGTEVSYDLSKISTALLKVNSRTNELSSDDMSKILQIINNKIDKLKDPIYVEDIQNIVEDSLMKNHFYKTAKSYILYRDNRTRIRENKSKLLKEISDKIYAKQIVNQNANIDEMSFGGRKGEADSVLMKQFALDNCMSKMARDNHLNNEIYIHKLNCGIN